MTPVILKRDPSRIRIAQVDKHSHRVRLSYAHCEGASMMGNHLLCVDPAERVHLPSRAHVRREHWQMLEQHFFLPLAHPKCQRRWHPHLRFLRRTRSPWLCSGSSSGIGITIAIGSGREGNTLQRRVRRELFGAHEYTCEVEWGPLGVGGVLVPGCNGAEDDVWSRGGCLLLEF
jgi:hypothetical protein